jgi:hypothetical protein
MEYIIQWVMTRLLHGCIAGVHATKHCRKNINTCLHLYSNIVILCHDTPGIYYALVHAWRVQQRVIYTMLLLYRSDAYVVITHPIISHSCVSCMCLYTVFLPLNRFRMFCPCIYVTVIEEDSERICSAIQKRQFRIFVVYKRNTTPGKVMTTLWPYYS